MTDSDEHSPAQIVCTMGMHRAGTSVTSRALNMLGVHLGPEDGFFAPRKDNNPKGFFENREMTNLNMLVFQAMGGLWKDPPPLPDGWEQAPELESLRERAREVILETFDGAPLWGWKDPRNCLTLPFWQTILPEMRYVICIRNPIDVAASLRARNELPAEQSFRIWLRYVASSINYTAGNPRLFVFFEDYFEDGRAQVLRLASFIGRPDQVDQPAVEELIEGWIEEGLWHHRTSPEDAIRHPDLPLEVKSLYLAVLLGYRAEEAGDESAGEALNLYARSLELSQGWNVAPRAPA